MDDDIDIYEDLPSFEAKCSENLVASNDSDNIVVENGELKKEIATLRAKLEDFGKVNKTLEVNLFSLLKTAKAEIARKDKMIDDLRKKLDDMTFRRGTYRDKNDERTARRSSVHETVANKPRYDSADNRYTPPSEDDSKVFEATRSPTVDHCRLRDPENKSSTLAPITVFSERLRKRIADEQASENKDNWSRKLSSSGSGGGTYTEGHVVESDKENGSLCDRHFYKGTEILSTLSNGEILKIPSADSRSSKRIEGSTVKSTNKRVHEDSNRVVSAKRLKAENGESLFDSTGTKEKKENASVESNAQYYLSKRTDRVELVSNESSEKQHTAAKSTNVGRACELSLELNKHRSVASEVDAGKRKEGKGYVKPERFNETRQRTARTPHDAEPLKRDDHRADNAKHHWSRQAEREDRGSVEYRTRGKFSSHTTKQRKEVHEKHFAQEKRRYFRATEEKKWTVASKVEETRDSRSTMRRRATVDREYDSRKTTDSHSRKCIPVREKSVSKTTIDREKKQAENEEHSREKSNACEKLDERSQCSKVKAKRNEKKVEKPVREVIDRKENKDIVAVSREEKSEILADKVKNDSSKDLEDGEIASTPNTSTEKSFQKQKSDLPSAVDAAKEIVETLRTETTASPLSQSKLTPKAELLHCLPSAITTGEHPTDAASSTNRLNLDTSENNVENLENIEKFIRDYASNDNIVAALSTVDSSKTNDSSKNNAQLVDSPGNDKPESTSVAENLQDSGKVLGNVVASSGQLVVDDLLDDERRKTKETVERTCSQEMGKEETRVQVLEDIKDESRPAENSLRVTTNLESAIKEEARVTDSSNQIKDDPAADAVASETRPSNEPKDTVPLEINGCAESQTPNEGKKVKDSSQSDHCDNEKATRKDRESKKREDVGEKERNGKRTGQEKDGGEAKRGETDGNSRGSGGNRSARDAPMRIHGKIVVFVRRKKPVCLADNNANMTVMANSSSSSSGRCEASRNSSGLVEEKKR